MADVMWCYRSVSFMNEVLGCYLRMRSVPFCSVRIHDLPFILTVYTVEISSGRYYTRQRLIPVQSLDSRRLISLCTLNIQYAKVFRGR